MAKEKKTIIFIVEGSSDKAALEKILACLASLARMPVFSGEHPETMRLLYKKCLMQQGKMEYIRLFGKASYFYSQLYSQHVIIIWVGNKSWVNVVYVTKSVGHVND